VSKRVVIRLTESDAIKVQKELRQRMYDVYESPKDYADHHTYKYAVKESERLVDKVERQVQDQIRPLHSLRPEQQEVAKALNYFYLNAPMWRGSPLDIEEKLLFQDMLVYMRFGDGDYEDHDQLEQYKWSKRVLEHPDIDQF